MPDWIVPLPDRLDVFLAVNSQLGSRAKVQQAIDSGLVRVNDALATKPAMRLQEGDTVHLDADPPPLPPSSAIIPVHIPMPELFEDDACMVLGKPAGYAVHPGAGMEPDEVTILSGIAWLLRKRSLPFAPEHVLVHRLDKETTGCLLIAKTADAHRTLQKQFETRTVQKTYLTLVAGIPDPPEAVIDAPIGRSTSNRTKMAVLGAGGPLRAAQTTYHTLGTSPLLPAALLSCDLHTGRTHQIRVHLSSIGHPVLGDDTYVSTASERVAAEFEIPRVCLHAWKLSFVSPADGRKHDIIAAPPEDFLRVTKRLQIDVTLL